VEGQRLCGANAVDLSLEHEVCDEVLLSAQDAISRLGSLVEGRVSEHPEARSVWLGLTRTLRAALGRLGGEFQPKEPETVENVEKAEKSV
jgi:hypothetical protein